MFLFHCFAFTLSVMAKHFGIALWTFLCSFADKNAKLKNYTSPRNPTDVSQLIHIDICLRAPKSNMHLYNTCFVLYTPPVSSQVLSEAVKGDLYNVPLIPQRNNIKVECHQSYHEFFILT